MGPSRHLRAIALGAVVAGAAAAGCVLYLRPQCVDEIRNGHETDVDCGGTCQPCALGRSCRSGADCVSGNCVSGTCVPQPCFNGVKDGAETDVDCGGGTCHKCAGVRQCLSDSDCFSGTCTPGTNVCSALANVSFAPGVSYSAGLKTYVLFSGDLDLDGNVDLVAANEEADSVTVLLGLGDGTFQHAGPNSPTGAYPTGGAIADFNGDGIPDVVTANYHGNSVSVLFGVGDGTLGAPSDYPTAVGAQTSNLAVGDLNGDGHLDVVATNPGTGSVSLFLGRSGGALDPAIDLPVAGGGSAPFSAVIDDFDGDGQEDVAVADMIGRAIVVRHGNGDGTFGPEVAFPEGGVPAYICLGHDVDLDGTIDLVCANRSSDDVSVLLGHGDGSFGDPITSGTGAGTGPYSLAVTDFNLDGVPDVVTADFLTGTASVLLGIGDGKFEAPIDAGSVGVFTYGTAVGDFDGDGKPDFAVCNAVSSDVVVKLNTSQ